MLLCSNTERERERERDACTIKENGVAVVADFTYEDASIEAWWVRAVEARGGGLAD